MDKGETLSAATGEALNAETGETLSAESRATARLADPHCLHLTSKPSKPRSPHTSQHHAGAEPPSGMAGCVCRCLGRTEMLTLPR